MSRQRIRLVFSLTRNEKDTLIKIANYEGGLSLAATLRHIVVEAARQRNLDNLALIEQSSNQRGFVSRGEQN